MGLSLVNSLEPAGQETIVLPEPAASLAGCAQTRGESSSWIDARGRWSLMKQELTSEL
jgi:hypothetical protein